MAFTQAGLKEIRKDYIESIAKINLVNAENHVLCSIAKESFQIQNNDSNDVITAVATGDNVGKGNTVTGYTCVDASEQILYQATFENPSTCVTELDTFTVNVTVGN